MYSLTVDTMDQNKEKTRGNITTLTGLFWATDKGLVLRIEEAEGGGPQGGVPSTPLPLPPPPPRLFVLPLEAQVTVLAIARRV